MCVLCLCACAHMRASVCWQIKQYVVTKHIFWLQSHLALAKLYLFQENLKLAEHELVTVLQTFPNDDNATLMLAELKFRSNDYVNAISHYKYILNRKPSEKMNVRY